MGFCSGSIYIVGHAMAYAAKTFETVYLLVAGSGITDSGLPGIVFYRADYLPFAGITTVERSNLERYGVDRQGQGGIADPGIVIERDG